ncbi:unnamed protein product [Allacma fusca]|uniref:Uncharacterized protein n=1 Tax=Allacma fusca TaxID=39272 RepID=A0A8J2NVQ6_9HEXA|nr:unnamed protein product [Allacma fusca]
MGYYYINSSLLCAVIIGSIVILLESIALSDDIMFTEKYQYSLKADDLCQHFINGKHNVTSANKDFTLLRRDLPFEPLSIFIASVTVTICIISHVVTWIFRNTKAKMVLMLNKFLTISATIAFFGCCVLISASFVIYDFHYIDFNDGQTTGCNMNYNHEYVADKDCDRKYSVCQRKDLKAAAFLLSLVCGLLGISGLLRDLKAKNTTKDFAEIFSPDKSFIVEPHQDEDIISIRTAQNGSSLDME